MSHAGESSLRVELTLPGSVVERASRDAVAEPGSTRKAYRSDGATVGRVHLIPAVLLTAGIVALIARVSWVGRRSVRRDDAHPERVRVPRIVLWIGIGGLPFMLIVLIASFGSGDTAMTVVPLLLIGVFGFLILLYANWWLVVGPNRLTFRTALGRVRTIRYEDVTHVRVVRRYNATKLSLRAADGTRFSINPGTFDVSPLLKALQEQGWKLSARHRRP